uniref:Uncharacterized protein n=1 Tax=Plectus sambesii TaxID=2011161 RepID=A0A914VGA1_9BILA
LVEAADDFVERSALTLDCLLNKLKESDDLTEFFPNRPHDPQQSATKTKKRKIFEDDEGGDEAFPDGYAAAANAHTAVDDGDGKRAINKE